MFHGSCEKQTQHDGVNCGRGTFGRMGRGLQGGAWEPSRGSEPGKSRWEEEMIAQKLSPWSWGRKVSSAGLFADKLPRLPGGPRAKVERVLLLPRTRLPSDSYLGARGEQPWEV